MGVQISYNHKPPLSSYFILCIFLVTLLYAGLSYNATNMTSYEAGNIVLQEDLELLNVNATILEVISGHAWINHGEEANAAIKCLNNNGSTRSFKTFGFKDVRGRPVDTNLWLCFDGVDWYAVVTTALEKVGGNRVGRLITAYMVDPKKFMVIEDFITTIKDKWDAHEITFVIQAGSIFLSPR